MENYFGRYFGGLFFFKAGVQFIPKQTVCFYFILYFTIYLSEKRFQPVTAYFNRQDIV